MKIKHNKKRNTAFVYEALVREVTIAVIKNDADTKDKAVKIIKKHFKPNSVLRKHLECYQSLYENQNLDEKTSEKIVNEAKMASRMLDTNGLFVGHSELIDDVNKELSPSVFNNFVPNYKTLASIYQIFSSDMSPKSSVILENKLIKDMMNGNILKEDIEPIDNITLNSFIGKFNKKYEGTLSEQQKNLLNLYISSFTDNSLSLKSFLNEEIARLKIEIKQNIEIDEIASDKEMVQKTKKVIELLEGLRTATMNDELLIKILKTQELVKEIKKDVNND
jgi:hypothetical protein